eukprot:GILI01052971.1.p1 GENE.GILI01052971.1~~GILI01052971.1.p1  ORF type:complete len:107 (-),score=5.64 GILI01052971.1:58-378(-)
MPPHSSITFENNLMVGSGLTLQESFTQIYLESFFAFSNTTINILNNSITLHVEIPHMNVAIVKITNTTHFFGTNTININRNNITINYTVGSGDFTYYLHRSAKYAE